MGTNRSRTTIFAIGDAVRYQPGNGTYGYEDALEKDGRLPGVVIGFSPTRVRVELTLAKRRGATVTRCVDAESLRLVCESPVTDPAVNLLTAGS